MNLSRNLFSLIWDMTRWNRMDNKTDTGGKPNKSTANLFALWKHSEAFAYYTMSCITIDWNQSASQYLRWTNLTGSIDRYMRCIVCARQECRIFSKCKKTTCTLVWVSPVAILILKQFQHGISQKTFCSHL